MTDHADHSAHGGPDGLDRFSALAATWDDNPRAVARAATLADAIRARIPLSDTTSAVEIGGGTGLLARALAGDIGSALVTDVAPGMVETAAQVLTGPRATHSSGSVLIWCSVSSRCITWATCR